MELDNFQEYKFINIHLNLRVLTDLDKNRGFTHCLKNGIDKKKRIDLQCGKGYILLT